MIMNAFHRLPKARVGGVRRAIPRCGQVSGTNPRVVTHREVYAGFESFLSFSTAISRILNFCTLPVTVIGNSSTNQM